MENLRECTWCAFARSLYARDLAKELTDYVAHLPEEIKCSEQEHVRRLEICRQCPKCVNGLCGYCGCFVLARAAKKALDCPEPAGSKWKLPLRQEADGTEAANRFKTHGSL